MHYFGFISFCNVTEVAFAAHHPSLFPAVRADFVPPISKLLDQMTKARCPRLKSSQLPALRPLIQSFKAVMNERVRENQSA